MEPGTFARARSIVFSSLLLALASGPVHALSVAFDVTISNTLSFDDPMFPDGQLSGTLQFWGPPDIAGDSALIGDPIAIAEIGPGVTYPTDSVIPHVFPQDPIRVSFTGIIDSDTGVWTAYFMPPDPVLTSEPPDVAPLIDLGSFAAGITSLFLTGPIYAWDDPFQVGTWAITARVVPAPATLALFGLGLLGLGFAARRKQ